MPTIETAAVTAVAFVALYAGHMVGDHPVQSCDQAAKKGAPDAAALAAGGHPWRGWSACAGHVASYAGCQAVALVLAAIVAPLTIAGAIAALAISAATHAVIDRRWIVRAIVAAKRAEDWPDGPYLIDQSLHIAAMFVAAIAAAVVTSPAAAAAVIAACLALLAAAAGAERARALRTQPSRPVSTGR